jgi:hypothetical protein
MILMDKAGDTLEVDISDRQVVRLSQSVGDTSYDVFLTAGLVKELKGAIGEWERLNAQ